MSVGARSHLVHTEPPRVPELNGICTMHYLRLLIAAKSRSFQNVLLRHCRIWWHNFETGRIPFSNPTGALVEAPPNATSYFSAHILPSRNCHDVHFCEHLVAVLRAGRLPSPPLAAAEIPTQVFIRLLGHLKTHSIPTLRGSEVHAARTTCLPRYLSADPYPYPSATRPSLVPLHQPRGYLSCNPLSPLPASSIYRTQFLLFEKNVDKFAVFCVGLSLFRTQTGGMVQDTACLFLFAVEIY